MRYSSGANIGSHAGRRTGFCFKIFSTFSGTYFFSTTRRNMYSLNHSSVMIRWPLLAPGPQLFSTIHFLGWPLASKSTAISVMAWEEPLEKVFPTKAVKGTEAVARDVYKADSFYVCKHKVAKPSVFIPLFPGTNCEYDTARAFERAGAEAETFVVRN